MLDRIRPFKVSIGGISGLCSFLYLYLGSLSHGHLVLDPHGLLHWQHLLHKSTLNNLRTMILSDCL